MNLFNIKRQFAQMKEKGWTKLYWSCDIHDCLIKGTYTKFNEGKQLYPGAEEVLKWLTNRKDMCLILWSSSHPSPIMEMYRWLKEKGVVANYINENPECQSNELCNFQEKFYFSILLDDKAGFEGETDWLAIKQELIDIGEWSKDGKV